MFNVFKEIDPLTQDLQNLSFHILSVDYFLLDG